MKNLTVILRMTNACNLDCTYCYDKKNRMNVKDENEKIRKKINEIVSNINKIQVNKNEKAKIIFHGGEPLLIEPDIYVKIIEKVRMNNPRAEFSIQTNGTLLNKEYIEIFKKYNVNLGISIDGYNETQNKCRIFKNGKNSFNIVMKNIRLLQENNVRFGIIMTLAKGMLGHEKELYDFIANNKLGCNMRPAFKNETTDNDFVLSNEEFYEFFVNIFEIWYNDAERIKLTQIREIYEEFAKALNPNYRVKNCSVCGDCFRNFVSLDVDGNLYSCNRTYKNDDFFYGNMREITIEELYNKMKEFIEKRQKSINQSKCKKCIIFKHCMGGCPANAYSMHGTIWSSDDYFCEAKIAIYQYMKRKLQEIGAIEEYEKNKKG